MKTDNLKNKLGEEENLSFEEQRVSELVGRLDKVSAPNDFDFRLKARIAARRENYARPSAWHALRYALPLTAVLVIAAFVMVQGGLFAPASESPADSIVAESQTRQPVSEPATELSNREVVESVPPTNNTETPLVTEPPVKTELPVQKASAEKKPAGLIPVQRRVRVEPKPAPSEDPISSKDFTVRPSNVQIMPEGVDPVQRFPENKEPQKNAAVSAREILNMLGAETVTEGNKLKVRSVKDKSLAARSGVKPGDVVEAIDGQKLDGQDLSPTFSGGKTITVTREGKVLKIELTPK